MSSLSPAILGQGSATNFDRMIRARMGRQSLGLRKGGEWGVLCNLEERLRGVVVGEAEVGDPEAVEGMAVLVLGDEVDCVEVYGLGC